MKIALVHDYLTQKGGAERVFELFCHYFPNADVFTSLYEPKKTISLGDRTVNTTILQQIPGAKKYFRLLAPFYYEAFRALDLQDYDLIISSTSSFAKAVKKRPGALHICFCHNVTRFLWNTQTYLREYKDYKYFAPLLERIFKGMRKVDIDSSCEPDVYIANSSTVATRIQKIYNKQAKVINYPIDSHKFIYSVDKEDFYLISSRLIGYKRIDIAIEAFNWLGLPLIIIGSGPEKENLEAKALDNIQFLGHVSDRDRTQLMSKARAVIVTGLEDYGLVPIEANASGTPVIAYGAGGILDTQIDGITGILFKPQTPEALQAALLDSRRKKWDNEKIKNHALNNFSEPVFFQQVKEAIAQLCREANLSSQKSIGTVVR
jgi:glycosyltransferase involved in cell wall biosynthesis